jgi:hypothetical protein
MTQCIHPILRQPILTYMLIRASLFFTFANPRGCRTPLAAAQRTLVATPYRAAATNTLGRHPYRVVTAPPLATAP